MEDCLLVGTFVGIDKAASGVLCGELMSIAAVAGAGGAALWWGGAVN